MRAKKAISVSKNRRAASLASTLLIQPRHAAYARYFSEWQLWEFCVAFLSGLKAHYCHGHSRGINNALVVGVLSLKSGGSSINELPLCLPAGWGQRSQAIKFERFVRACPDRKTQIKAAQASARLACDAFSIMIIPGSANLDCYLCANIL